MNRRLITVLSLVVLMTSGPLVLQGQDPARNGKLVGVYQAKNSPATDLCQAVATFLDQGPGAALGERPVIVPEPISNSIMVRGEAAAVKQIHEMLKQLDRKPASVFVEVVILMIESDQEPGRIELRGDGGTTAEEVVKALSKQGRLQVLARAQLTALHNQAAFLQVGKRTPRVIGVRESSTGRTRSVELENVGLVLGLTPRIAADGIVTMEVDLERSDLAIQEDGIELIADGDRAADVITLSLQTTLSAQSGRTVVLGGLTEGVEGKWCKLVAMVTPTVIE